MTALTAVKPNNNLGDFAKLSHRNKSGVCLWLSIVTAIDQAENKSLAISDMAEILSHKRGFSAANINTKYYAWARCGRDWRALINKAQLKRTSPEEQVSQIYRRYAEDQQRSSKEAYRRMMRDFRAGKPLPPTGITWRDVWTEQRPGQMPPATCPDWTPDGWTYGTLQRKAGLTKYQAKAVRIGRGAARDFLPSVYTTRNGLAVGQMYQFDDVWHDIMVSHPSQNKPVRPLEFACIDVFSACKVTFGMKPRLSREDGTRMNLNEQEMRFLLAHLLCNIGYNAETGCTLIVEHGTAAISTQLEDDLKNWSNGLITVQRSGILGEQIHAGLFPGRGRGNFKVKAALESSHNIAHIIAGHLPGQVGTNSRTAQPEQLSGMVKYQEDILKAAAKMTPERVRMLMLPFLSFNQYQTAIHELYDVLNWRTWHHLEGWIASELETAEFRVMETADWMPMDHLLTMPTEQRHAIEALICTRPELRRTRQLAPAEVWEAGKEKLTTLPKLHIPEILGPKSCMIKRVDHDGLIKFRDVAYGPDEHRYLAQVVDPDGFHRALTPNRQYALQINPYDPSEAFISEPESGELLGIAPRWQTVCKADTEAVQHLMGKQAHIEKHRLDPIRDRHADQAADRLAMIEHNRDIIEGEVLAPSEFIQTQPDRFEADEDALIAATCRVNEQKEEWSSDEISELLRD